MATNKKKVKKSANGEASAKAAAVSSGSGSGSGSGAASRAAAAATNATSGPSVPTLSNVKFTMLILLGVGVKFAMDYASAVSAGTESKDCAAYIQNVTECSATDVAMIRLKYHSTLTTIAMVAMTAWNVRANEPLLLRLLSALLFAPLLFTVMALQATRAWMDPMKNFWIGINVTVLFIVVMKAFGNAPVLAPFVRSVDLSTMTVLTLLTARVYDITKFLQEETEGYVVVQTLPVTAPAKALLYFLVVDKATVVVLLVFALAFLNYDNRRVSLQSFQMSGFVDKDTILSMHDAHSHRHQ
jgi:hypothetical protein